MINILKSGRNKPSKDNGQSASGTAHRSETALPAGSAVFKNYLTPFYR